MGSKEVAISAPLVVLLYDRVFLSPSWREVFRRRWGFYVGLAATWAIMLTMLSYGAEGPPCSERARAIEHTIDYTLAQFGVIAHYLRLCFWPHPLVVDYGFYTPQTARQIIPYALLIGGLFWRRRWRRFATSLGWVSWAFGSLRSWPRVRAWFRCSSRLRPRSACICRWRRW